MMEKQHRDSPLFKASDCVTMAHGSGGRLSTQLIDSLFKHYFDNRYLAQGNDSALLGLGRGRMVMSTDAHVISPIFFPGGDIGSLAVHGTINDVAMSGAVPCYLSAAFILEEGFPLVDLERVVVSMAMAAEAAGVAIVTGDTKVVERGKGDGIFITTTGIGFLDDSVNISGDLAIPGDVVMISGTVGDHGMAVLSKREHLCFETALISDSAALHGLVASMLEVSSNIHCLRDPTRGGLATTLHELAEQSQVSIILDEVAIPLHPAVRGASELLGLDPLYIANEGKLVCICPEDEVDALLSIMQAHPLGKNAAVIGHVLPKQWPPLQMRTPLGGVRVVDWLAAEQLPRIC
ncbi:MAG: hydrogenase expression/formation protein HypE [Zetaproteobacteria bacterium]|nr:hydrogenase expression/formation protein HypE [Zetaproteobacteria bacterium]